MARARTSEHGVPESQDRGAAAAAPRSNPLGLVEVAVAGGDLATISRSAAVALDRPVAISLATLGTWAEWPDGSFSPEAAAAIRSHSEALVGDTEPESAPPGTDLVPVRLGEETLGVVAVLATPTNGSTPSTSPDPRPWLEAAAAAAAVTTLMRTSAGAETESARRAFLQMLQLHSPTDMEDMLARARRLGYDFSGGAIGICAEVSAETSIQLNGISAQALVADMGEGRLVGLIPLDGDDAEGTVAELTEQLTAANLTVIASAPHRGPAGLAEAVQEATVLLELLGDSDALLSANEETYRLLVGVLIRNPDELFALRASTVAEIEAYDEAHDTELLTTLETFLAHHGSTTDTAEAMSLHRHTVGYRLARVQEVSGLSPYESDGRERLSLGLKAHRILLANSRRTGRPGSAPAA